MLFLISWFLFDTLLFFYGLCSLFLLLKNINYTSTMPILNGSIISSSYGILLSGMSADSPYQWFLSCVICNLFYFIIFSRLVFMASTIVNVVLWAGVYFTYLLYDPDLEGRVFVLMIFFSLHNPAQGFGWSMGFIHICC